MICDIGRAATAGGLTMQLTMWMEPLEFADGPLRRLGHEAFMMPMKLMKGTAERNDQRPKGCITEDTNLPLNVGKCWAARRGRTQGTNVNFMRGDATIVVTMKSGTMRPIAPRGLLRETPRTPSGARSVAGKPYSRCCEALICTSAEKTRARGQSHKTGTREIADALRRGTVTRVGIDIAVSMGTEARAKCKCMDVERLVKKLGVNMPQ